MFYVLLEGATQQAAGVPKQSMLASLLPFALMFAILYFLIIRPQRKNVLYSMARILIGAQNQAFEEKYLVCVLISLRKIPSIPTR